MRLLGRVILALVIAPGVAPSYGSPRSDPTTGRAVFTGATMAGATSISLNPAALGLARSWEVYFAATGVLEQFGIDRRELDLDTDTLVAGQKVSRPTRQAPMSRIASAPWSRPRRSTSR